MTKHIMLKESNTKETHAEIIAQKLERERKHMDRRELIISFFVTLIVCIIVFGFLIGLGRVKGDSMLPAIHNKDLVVLWRLQQKYDCGDIVFFKKGGYEDEYVKRIIGVPGDTIDIEPGGAVVINNKILDEPYIYTETMGRADGVMLPITLKNNEYFVLGDNRGISSDSRDFGVVKQGEIDGKVIFVARGLMK